MQSCLSGGGLSFCNELEARAGASRSPLSDSHALTHDPLLSQTKEPLRVNVEQPGMTDVQHNLVQGRCNSSRICSRPCGESTGFIAMLLQMTSTCKSGGGAAVKCGALKCASCHFYPPSRSAGFPSETANHGVQRVPFVLGYPILQRSRCCVWHFSETTPPHQAASITNTVASTISHWGQRGSYLAGTL